MGKTPAPFDATIVEASDGRDLRFSTLEVTSDGRGVKVDLPSDARPLDSFDVGKLEITAKLDGGAMRPWLALQLRFSTNDHKDWLDGVRDSLRTARGQLSGERPGLVFIEAPAAARASKDGRLGAVKQVIDTAFRNSSRLSAVAICFTGWDDAAAEAVTQYHVERNPAARLPIAANYYVSDDVREEWRRTMGRNNPCPCGSGTKFKRCCLA